MDKQLRLARFLIALALASSFGACRISTNGSPAELPGDSVSPVELTTELSWTPVLATAPMRDTTRVAGGQGVVAVAGLLNQTPPCFTLSSAATKAEERIILRLTAREKRETCNTFAAGAFAYDVGVKGIARGTYDVEALHRVVFKDGRTAEEKVSSVQVKVR